MDTTKTICVTGHRDIHPKQLGYVREQLAQEIRAAVNDGYTHFIFGGAAGADILFAQIVAEFKDKGTQITLEADIPYRKRLQSPELGAILPKCDIVTVLSEVYSPSCFFVRNRDMIQKSSRVIAVYDGRERGGTFYTIRYARVMGCELRIVGL